MRAKVHKPIHSAQSLPKVRFCRIYRVLPCSDRRPICGAERNAYGITLLWGEWRKYSRHQICREAASQ